MGTVYKVAVKLRQKSGVENDSSVNVHHIYSIPDGLTVPLDTLLSWSAKFKTFYQACQGYWSPSIASTANSHTVQISRLSSGGAGADDDVTSPLLLEDNFTSSYAGSNKALPSEVAVCVSHRGIITGAPEESTGIVGGLTVHTRPRSSRRGRFFLGPLNDGAGQANASFSGNLEVSTAFRTDVLNAFNTFCISLGANVDPDMRAFYGVYSPTDDTFYSTTVAHIDNAFDTMRSRGQPASMRSAMNIDQWGTQEGNVSEVPGDG